MKTKNLLIPIFGAIVYLILMWIIQLILQSWLIFSNPVVLYWGHGFMSLVIAVYIRWNQQNKNKKKGCLLQVGGNQNDETTKSRHNKEATKGHRL